MSLLWPQRRACATITLLVAAGCGGDGGPLSIADARDHDGVVEIEGYLIERNGELRLCEAILESFPPQCGEPSLRALGVGLSPSEERTTLLGRIENGTIVVVEP